MKRKAYPSQDRIKSILTYNPDTGIFTWKELELSSFKYCKNPHMTCTTRNAIWGNKKAGSSGDNYVKIHFDGKNYVAHRLAWIYMYGIDQKESIDHINKNKKDNRLCNLRLASPQQNQQNYDIMRSNKTGVKGVSYVKKKKKYKVTIGVNNKNIHIGMFSKLKDAAVARYKAEEQYGFTKFNAESSSYIYLKEKGIQQCLISH
jgi:uncharacterized protein YpiB (UPF0302 family)